MSYNLTNIKYNVKIRLNKIILEIKSIKKYC